MVVTGGDPLTEVVTVSSSQPLLQAVELKPARCLWIASYAEDLV